MRNYVTFYVHCLPCVISGFRHEADVNCALLGCYAASRGYILLIFRDNLSVQSLKVTLMGRTAVYDRSLPSGHTVRLLRPQTDGVLSS